jgi:hypothetical protein
MFGGSLDILSVEREIAGFDPRTMAANTVRVDHCLRLICSNRRRGFRGLPFCAILQEKQGARQTQNGAHVKETLHMKGTYSSFNDLQRISIKASLTVVSQKLYSSQGREQAHPHHTATKKSGGL